MRKRPSLLAYISDMYEKCDDEYGESIRKRMKERNKL